MLIYLRETLLILDQDGRIVAIGIGQMEDPEAWQEFIDDWLKDMEWAKANIRFPAEEDRRGPFKTVTCGISYGGGQKV